MLRPFIIGAKPVCCPQDHDLKTGLPKRRILDDMLAQVRPRPQQGGVMRHRPVHVQPACEPGKHVRDLSRPFPVTQRADGGVATVVFTI
jgi:hypothetical protein